MGEYKDRNRYWIFSIFLTLIFFLSSINFIFADNHLSKIENLKFKNYSTTVYFSTDPKVGYLDLEIEFDTEPRDIKLLLIASLNDEKFQTYALSSNRTPRFINVFLT